MILSDRDIKKYLDSGKITVEPLNDRNLQIQPSSIDLRLGKWFKIFHHMK
jgi:dCTP deaminase